MTFIILKEEIVLAKDRGLIATLKRNVFPIISFMGAGTSCLFCLRTSENLFKGIPIKAVPASPSAINLVAPVPSSIVISILYL